MHVRDLMTAPAHTCLPVESLQEAASQMWRYDVGAIPVVDERGRAVGMITDRDVAMAAFLSGESLRDLPIPASMSRELYACRPGDSLAEAEALMARHRVRRLPVVDEGGRLVGVLSASDLARAAARGWRKYASSGLVEALGAIAQPRQPRKEKPPRREEAEADEKTNGVDHPELWRTVDQLKQKRSALWTQLDLERAAAREEWERTEADWRLLEAELHAMRSAPEAETPERKGNARQILRRIREGYRRLAPGR